MDGGDSRDAAWLELRASIVESIRSGLFTGPEVMAELGVSSGTLGGWCRAEDLRRKSDAGSANTSARLARYVESELVIHLLSRVHTPTDNPAAENKNGEIKRESGLGKGVRLASLEEGAARLEPARRRIDGGRLRASRGSKTAAALDRERPRADTLVTRETFYAEARSAMAEAVRGLTKPKAIRKAEQDAIWRVLEKHGLARARVGACPTPCPRLPPVAPRLAG